MKAAIFRAQGSIEVDDVPKPTLHAGEVLVRIQAAALNHRDLDRKSVV